MVKKYNEKMKRSTAYWKPKRYQHYKTTKELAVALSVDPMTLWKLEQRGIIPEPQRVKRGLLYIRLYSPQNEADIKTILTEAKYKKKPGRKPNDSN